MSGFKGVQEALVKRILEGTGKTSFSDRLSAFKNNGLIKPLNPLVDRVARHAHKVTDEDIAFAKMSGLSEDQVFEIVVCAAVGQASRQYAAALEALKAATGED